MPVTPFPKEIPQPLEFVDTHFTNALIMIRVNVCRLNGSAIMSEQQTTMWVFHTISLLRRALGMDWEQFSELVERYGLIAFLFRNYELLHYYDNDYIVNYEG
jgi:hypothetical protein